MCFGKVGALVLICLFALFIRLAIAWNCVGTNDVETWRVFGQLVEEKGLAYAYANDGFLNHPPLATLYSWTCWKTFLLTGARFDRLIKIPAIVADVVTCLLMFWWGSRIKDQRLGLRLAFLMAICPIAVLVSGYHGNTDNVYVMFLLWGCMELSRKRHFSAGILLGCALNVKVLPLVLFPAIFMVQRNWSDLRKLVYGLLISSIPFIIALINVGVVLIKKLFGYGSNEESWGLMYFFWMIGGRTREIDFWHGLSKSYNASFGKWIMLVFLMSLAWVSRRKRYSALHAVALAACGFLVIAPGFGVQYLVLPSVLLLASHPRIGFYVGCLSGMFVGMVYYQNANHAEYPTSRFYDLIQPPGTVVGLFTWGLLLIATIILLRDRFGRIDSAKKIAQTV